MTGKRNVQMRIITYLTAIFLLAVMQGCAKNEFSVEFEFSTDVSANYRLMYYASDKRTGWHMETVTTVEKGKGEAKCITRNPTLVYLYTLGSNRPVVAFYAERGDKITISGKSEAPEEWEIGGNDINREWSEWRKNNIKAVTSGSESEINSAVARYVEKNPDSRLSLILMLTTFSRRSDELLYIKLWNKLKDDALDQSLIRLIGRTDQPDGLPADAGTVSQMKLHCKGDTLLDYDPSAYKATIFYFNRNGSVQRKDVIDSLRQLTRLPGYKDQGMAVSVSFEADTLAWKNGTRKDSLSNGMEAWVFAGEADSRMMKIDVPRTPYFVVCGRDGKPSYRGSEYARALQKFRETLNGKK